MHLSGADELRLDGLTLLEAANADGASTILESHAARIGVVVTDIPIRGSMAALRGPATGLGASGPSHRFYPVPPCPPNEGRTVGPRIR